MALEPHRAAEEVLRVEIAEHEIGIRHRRFSAAAQVARGSRVAAGAVRPDLEQTGLVDSRDAAPARPDLDHFGHRHPQRQAASAGEAVHPRHLELGCALGAAVVDDADLGGGAAHVEGDHVAEPALGAAVRRGHRTPGGAGLDEAHGVLDRGVAGDGTAVGGHDERLDRDAETAQVPAQSIEVAAHDGADCRRLRRWCSPARTPRCRA